MAVYDRIIYIKKSDFRCGIVCNAQILKHYFTLLTTDSTSLTLLFIDRPSLGFG